MPGTNGYARYQNCSSPGYKKSGILSRHIIEASKTMLIPYPAIKKSEEKRGNITEVITKLFSRFSQMRFDCFLRDIHPARNLLL